MKDILVDAYRHLRSLTPRNLAARYLRINRKYAYPGLTLRVSKDVFHPGFFRSTGVMARWLERRSVKGLKVLELGCGSGLLSLLAAARGAIVTASDINPSAVENTGANALSNRLHVTTVRSDLFAALSGEAFDMVLINPPYYRGNPGSYYEYAWFCGEDLHYYRSLFQQCAGRPDCEKYYMVLSETCDLTGIKKLAQQYGIFLLEGPRRKISGELFTIYYWN